MALDGRPRTAGGVGRGGVLPSRQGRRGGIIEDFDRLEVGDLAPRSGLQSQDQAVGPALDGIVDGPAQLDDHAHHVGLPLAPTHLADGLGIVGQRPTPHLPRAFHVDDDTWRRAESGGGEPGRPTRGQANDQGVPLPFHGHRGELELRGGAGRRRYESGEDKHGEGE
jgi:hypothetical protein